MKKLLSIITLAIAFVSGLRAQVTKLKAELAERDVLVADLKNKLEVENIDDEELVERAEAAEEKTRLLLEELEAVEGKGDELALMLNDEPAVPSVDPVSFAVTGAATQSLGNLAVREHQSEGIAGQAPTPTEAAPGDAPVADNPNSETQE